MGTVESTGSRLSMSVVPVDVYHMGIFPDELRMGWCEAYGLRRDIEQEQETETYRVVRMAQLEGSHYWEIEVEYRPTGELFCVRWWAEWADRLQRDAGY